MIYKDFISLIGKTPLMELKNIEKKYALKARVLAKLEYFEPAGSIKDRVALNMIATAEKAGKLKEGGTIIEPTSGNTGIGLAAIAASKGYKAIFVMPSTMSVERIKILKGYGAEVVLTDGALGMKGAVEKAEELAKTIAGSFVPSQFENPANPEAHQLSTAKEIWADSENNVDIFIASIGTGGTVTGNSKYLKEKNPNLKTIGVEPLSSPLLTKGYAGKHNIQGIGANFVPKTLDMSYVDEIYDVSDEDAYFYARESAKTEGIMVGISSGAALAAAVKAAALSENQGKTIVVIFPDGGDKYLSTPLFE